MVKKMKMNFDFKKFFIEKGERVAFALAVIIMLVMVVMSGLSTALGNSSAAFNTQTLQKLNKMASNAMQTSKPTAELAALPPDLRVAKVDSIDPELFACERPFFGKDSQADRKWRQPKVLAPVEFEAEIMRGGIETYYFVLGEDKKPSTIAVLSTHDEKQDLAAALRMQSIFKRFNAALPMSGRGVVPGFPAGGVGGGGGGGGGGEGGGRRGRGGFGGGGGGGPGPGFGADLLARQVQQAQEQDLKFLTVQEYMENPAGKKLAKTVFPTRMAIVSGSFPYRAQLEEYRRALHFDSIESMLGTVSPEFLGIMVQRRTVKPNGEPITDWEDLDIDTPIKQLKLMSTGYAKENEEFQRYGIIVYPNRLVMPRPKLIRHENYPDEKLSLLTKVITDAKKSTEVVAPPPPPRKSPFEAEIDVWSENPLIAEGGSAQAPEPTRVVSAPGAPAAPGLRSGGPSRRRGRGGRFGGEDEADEPAAGGAAGSRNVQATRVPPEYCMFRFLDVTVEPGRTYEYQVKIEIANPNYNNPDRAVTESLTKDPSIVADQWTLVTQNAENGKRPLRVTVPDDLEYYAVNEQVVGDRGETSEKKAMQVQRWLDTVQVNPTDRASAVPVGDWTILRRMLVRRGEYIGCIAEAAVPVWKPTLNGFAFATPPEDEQRRGRIKRFIPHQGIPVDFGTDPLSDLAAGPILVDFDGGKKTAPNDPKTLLAELPYDVLIYSADNKLIVRNSVRDTDDPQRRDRYKDWEDWIVETRTKGKDTTTKTDRGAGMFGDEGGGRGRKGGRP
jgi:uncharacterized membrane protein YgcG